MPPAPTTSAVPNCGSEVRPMMSSATAPVTMRSTRTSGASFAMRSAASRTSSAVRKFSATPPASVLWAIAAEDTLRVTG